MSEATEIVEGPANDPIIRRDARDTYKIRAEQLKRDQIDVLSSEQGRRVLAWLVHDVCNFYGETFNEMPRRSAFDEGRKAIALKIRSTAVATGIENWHAIEVEVQKRRSYPTGEKKKTKENDDER
jgi:hypothetical protein